MYFINPVEILELEERDITQIDANVIKKARRKLQAEIELSDGGYFIYKGRQLTKSDTDSVINQIEDSGKLAFYHFIARNPALNNFLISGDESFFSRFQQENIYKQSAFIDFVSPFFAEQYDQSLLKAFKNNDLAGFKRILTVSPLTNAYYRDKAYSSILNTIRSRINEVEELIENIENETSTYNNSNIGNVLQWTKSQISADFINALPQTFQSIRNQAAQSVRSLAVCVFNNFSQSKLTLNLLTHALKFNADNLIRQKLNEDYKQVKAINDEKEKQERLEPIFKKYASILTEMLDKLKNVESKLQSPYHLNSWVNSKIDSSEINALDNEFSDIRNHLALGIRALSVAIWNNFQDIDTAISLIKKAGEINANVETRRNISDLTNQLIGIKRQQDSYSQASHKTSSSSKSDSNGCLFIFLAAALILILFAVFDQDDRSTGSSGYDSSTTSTSNSTSTSTASSGDQRDEATVISDSKYKGNSLKSGVSPLDGCFGKGKYAGQAWITFRNSNLSDAIVCLVNVRTGKTIRNEYIRAGADFTMSKIPSGTYYLKVYYGLDWNPTKRNFCGTKGGFDSGEHFSKSDNFSDYITVSNTEYSYTTGSITLYTVSDGNMSVESATAAEFFNN